MGSVRYKVDDHHNVTEIHKVVVHRFKVSDVEDPELYAAAPVWEWQQSDAGKFVMEHAIDKPVLHNHIDYSSYGYDYIIVAELEMKKLSEFYLKWGEIK